MDAVTPIVIRVMNNNAVLARSGDSEVILMGRGIGFACQAGDAIETANIQHQYLEVSPERIQFYKNLDTLNTHLLQTISQAVDLAGDLLGELHPSIYVLLADHLSFAVERLGNGEKIENNLVTEIRASFPSEFAAAELVLQYLNTHLDTKLPEAETAFITLHLNAARTGQTVKKPLQQVNRLFEIIQDLKPLLTRAGVEREPEEEFVTTLVRLAKRLDMKNLRSNAAASSISRDLHSETILAQKIIGLLIGESAKTRDLAGEIAYLAVFLHGWQQTGKNKKPRD